MGYQIHTELGPKQRCPCLSPVVIHADSCHAGAELLGVRSCSHPPWQLDGERGMAFRCLSPGTDTLCASHSAPWGCFCKGTVVKPCMVAAL